ncbi:hypothetical protein J6590_027601 [Homalodisca vitripennis]|nr:hypothetical protein J6590_027601 [Homalodisca vitripennis]
MVGGFSPPWQPAGHRAARRGVATSHTLRATVPDRDSGPIWGKQNTEATPSSVYSDDSTDHGSELQLGNRKYGNPAHSLVLA